MTTEPINMSNDEFKFNIKYPITTEKKRIYKIMKCHICNKEFATRNKWQHERTQFHIMYSKLNDKLRSLIEID